MMAKTTVGRAPEMVSLADVCTRLGVHRTTGYRMYRLGTFPIRVYNLRGKYKCKVVDVEHFFNTPSPAPNGKGHQP
jgi:hypothetical protein